MVEDRGRLRVAGAGGRTRALSRSVAVMNETAAVINSSCCVRSSASSASTVTISRSSDVHGCGQVLGRIPASVPGSGAVVLRANHCSITRTPLTWKSQASAGTGEMRPSPMSRACSSRS